VLHSSDIANRLDLDGLELTKLTWFIDREGFWFRGGSGDPQAGTWERNISGNIQRLVDVRTIDDYLEAVARLQGFPVDQPGTDVRALRAPSRRTPPPRRRSVRAMRALSRWQRKRDLTARDLLVITAAGGAIATIIGLALGHVI